MLYIISAIPMRGGLCHHGIKGQKWGVRRWQNADGTFNEAGKKRYFGDSKNSKPEGRKHGLSENQKRVLKIGAAVAATALTAYGVFKLNDFMGEKNYQRNMEAAKDFVTKLGKEYEKERRYTRSGPDASSFNQRNSEKQTAAAKKVYESVSRKGRFDSSKFNSEELLPDSYWEYLKSSGQVRTS